MPPGVIDRVVFNNRRRVFEVQLGSLTFFFPYACAQIQRGEHVGRLVMDRRDGREAFRYYVRAGRRALGRNGIIDVNDVLGFPGCQIASRIRRKLAREARKRVETTHFTTRQLIRALQISAPRYYRLLDDDDGIASIGQLLDLLEVLGAEVDVVVT